MSSQPRPSGHPREERCPAPSPRPLWLSGAVLEQAPAGAVGGCTADLPEQMVALEGHYPGLPLVPGVFLVEIAAGAEAAYQGVPCLGATWAGVGSARFRSSVRPGERLCLERRHGEPRPQRGEGSRRKEVARWTLYRGGGSDAAAVAVVELVLEEGREGVQAGPGGADEVEHCGGSRGVSGSSVSGSGCAAGAARDARDGGDLGGGQRRRLLPVHPEQVIPHREPMLLVDGVVCAEPGSQATVLYTVTGRAADAAAGRAARGAAGQDDQSAVGRAARATAGAVTGQALRAEAAPAARVSTGQSACTVADLAGGLAGPAEQPWGVPVPWPLVLESWLQAAVLLAAWDQPCPDVRTGGVPLLGGVREVRFGAQPLPGTVLEHRVAMTARRGGTAVLSGSTWAGGTQVLSVGRASLARRPPESLP